MNFFNFLKTKKDDNAHHIITDFSSRSSEAIQKLEIGIDFGLLKKGPKVIALTSAVQAEGKTTLIVNMANIYAMRGAKVCLVNLDIRRPTIHGFYKLKNSIGVVDYISEDVALDDIINHINNGVDVINSGSITPFPTKILSSPKMHDLFNGLKAKGYDYILVDTPPMLVVSDAIICARHADGVIMVARQYTTKKKDVSNAIKELKDSSANILSIVISEVIDSKDFRDKTGNYYYYYKN